MNPATGTLDPAPPSGDGRPHPDGPADLSTLVREPQQERSRKTLRRIVETAQSLLAREGPDSLTVTGIARRAHASVGSFYARFDGKEELIRYVGESALAEALEEWDEALAEVEESGDGSSPLLGPALRGLSLRLLAAVREGPARRLRLLHGLEDPAPARLVRFEGRVRGDLGWFLRHRGAGERQARVASGALVATLQAFSSSTDSSGDDGDPAEPLDREVLAAEAARMLELYLSGEATVEAPEPEQPAAEAAAESSAEPAAEPAADAEAEPAPEPAADADAEPAAEPDEPDEPEPDDPDVGGPEPVDPFDPWGDSWG